MMCYPPSGYIIFSLRKLKFYWHYRNTHRPTPCHTEPHRPTPSHADPEKCFKYAHRPTPTLKNALNTHTDPHRPGVALRLT